MFKNIKKTDFIIIIVLLGIALTLGYYYTNSLARTHLWQTSYSIRASLATHQITCSDNSPAWLADMLRYQTRNNNAPANQIAYITPDGTLHHCENGYIGDYPLLSNPITPQTRYRYASVTKLWTADATLSLIKNGKLSLDTKLSDIITEIDTPTDSRINDITIGQLLAHRAGFDRYSVFGQDMFGIGKDICPNHINELNKIELGFTPDTKTSYSNLGYCLLGEVISRTYDMPYTDVIAQKYDFNNNGLRFISNQAMDDEVTYNYVETGLTGHADIYTAFDYDGLASAAGLSGNAVELAKQVRAMANKPVPNIMTTSASADCDTTKITECYGLAMLAYQKDTNAPLVYYRSGALLGLSSLVAVDERGGTVALLSNGSPSNGETDNNKVKKIIYDHMTTEK